MDEVIEINSVASNESTRQLASIQRIVSLTPIVFINKDGQSETAGAIERARILGWDCVVKKGEFQIGDLGVYFEIDSIIPFNPWSDFLKDKNRPEKPIRLKSIKMKGQLSQGLLLPVKMIHQLDGMQFVEGQDITQVLGVTKYEPVLDATLRGKARGTRPSYIQKTDEDRIQSNLRYFNIFKDKEVYISQKMDGSSFSAAYFKKEFHVCSRNMDMIRNEDVSFWKIALKYKLDEILQKHYEETGEELVVQGELCGEGIQKNRIGLKGLELYVFNITNICGNKDYGLDAMIAFCAKNGLKVVPIKKRTIFNYQNVDELLAEAEGTYENGHPNEGIVIRPVVPDIDPKTGGRLSFKVISNSFLLKTGE